jgi:hypothetical protein
MHVSYTEVDLSTKDLADIVGCTPRMINLYRSAVEHRTGRSLGYKSGKTMFFTPEEQAMIRGERDRTGNMDSKTVNQAAQTARESATPNYAPQAAAAEGTMGDAMGAIVAQADNQAIAMGQMLGQRFNSLLMATMTQTMAQGMVELQTSMGELTASLQCSVPAAPALNGQTLLALEGDADIDLQEDEIWQK